jgi:two-component system, chemotaxis family, protein-glutamate methylesterase/glutaminase
VNETAAPTSSSPAPAIIAVGASAGGVTALGDFVAGLTPDLPAAVLVALHVSPSGPSVLPAILNRSGRLPVAHATDGEALEAGAVRVAPPDHHMVVRSGRIEINLGPRENGHRPAIDPLFRSVATSHGPSAVGVVLTGMLDDGTAGLGAIQEAGGTTIAQDPSEAPFPQMPSAAIAAGVVQHVAPVAGMGEIIAGLDLCPVAVRTSRPRPSISPDVPMDEPDGPPSFSCPACGGVLNQIDARSQALFQCRTGHRYGAESLVEAQIPMLDEAMWAGYRSLREHADLSRRVARRLEGNGLADRAQSYRRRAADAERRSEALYAVLTEAHQEQPG